jgi:hypothetical protein
MYEHQRLAYEVLIKSRDQLIKELALCASGTGVGRAPNYAPVLVNVQNAIKVLEELKAPAEEAEAKNKAWNEKMLAVRMAKKAAREKPDTEGHNKDNEL